MTDAVAAAPPKAGFPYKTEPMYPRQREIARDTWKLPFHFLNMEQGTGKSWVTIVTAAALYLHKKIDGMIVLAPNNVHIAWAMEQLPEHMPDVVPWEAYIWLSDKERGWENKRKAGKVARDDNRLLQLARDKSKFPVLCVNSESITIPLVAKAIGTMLTLRQCLFVVDESGDFTKPSGKRTLKLMQWRHRAPYRRCLDGTIMSTEPLELYSPYRFLHPGILGYNTFGEMKEDVAEWEMIERGPETIQDDGTWKRKSIPVIAKDENGKKKWKNLDQLRAKIAPHTTRVTKAEVLPWLPPKQYHKRFFSLSAEQWRLIGELWEDSFTTLGDGNTVTAQNVLTVMLRVQQITCGYVPPDVVYGEDDERSEPVSILPGVNNRLEAAVQEVLAYNGAPTIVWTRFKFDIDLLAPRLRDEGLSVVTYDGRMTQAAKETAKQDFMAGNANVFVGNPAAGGRGLNLQRAHKVLYYANYFGLRRRLQSEDRAHRIGTQYVVDVTDLIGYRSIDLKIVKALRENKEVADVLSGDPTVEWI
jgi:hypothetical protein